MPESLARLQQQALELWREMDKSQRMRIILITVLIIASISLALFIITRPNYERLFSGRIDPREIGEMSKILKDNKIEHRLADGGSSIEVKLKDKDIAQIILAQAGYPRGGITFKDALSSIKLSTTESDRKKIFKEYDEQKIANSLKKIDNILDAVVNLSIPERNSFLGDSKEDVPTAAVLVEAKYELTTKQIKGIERFVAASVEGLTPENVKIIDKVTGNVLNDHGDEDLTVNTDKQREYQMGIKKEVENKVKELFVNMYDDIRVGANIICNFDKETTKQVEYIPVVGGESGILRSSQISKEEVQNGTSGGVPGTDSNTSNTTPSYPNVGGTGSSYKKSDIINNYEINQKNTEITKAIGQMDKEKSSITVSLFYGNKIPNGPGQSDIDNYRKMIATATGIAEKNITIASFKLPPVKVEKPKIDWMKLVGQIGPFALLGILILLLIVGVIRKGDVSKELVLGGPIVKTSGGTGLSNRFSIPKVESEPLPEIELEEKSEIKKQIDAFVKRKPQAVAQLLRNWLSDEWN